MAKFLIVGSGGREAMFAKRLAEDSQVCAVLSHENPTILECARRSGGVCAVSDPDDPRSVLEFAKRHRVDYAFVNADQPLANGVVDMLLENDIKAVGPTRDAARIEWDKAYAMDMMRGLYPGVTPHHSIVSDRSEMDGALAEFQANGMQVVVKPQGLTGGKGVKVMPEHLASYEDCRDYAGMLLDKYPDQKVLLVEKIDGIEFTIMGITDGKSVVPAPASYDYPFRYEGDLGAGTGGMGCFTGPDKKLPFMDEADWDGCVRVMQGIVDEMRGMGVSFNGVLNGGFFKTKNGIRFMEFNSRFGDPECLNVLSVLEGSFANLLVSIYEKTLSQRTVSFAKRACVTKYLVGREYPEAGPPSEFGLDEHHISEMGVDTVFATCVRANSGYRTLGRSRVISFGATANTIEEAASLVNSAIDGHVGGSLEYRKDIGTKKSLDSILQRASRMRGA